MTRFPARVTTRQCTLGLLFGPWLAVSAAAQDALVLEEVVVTAQKREQTLEDIPSTVTVLSARQLELSQTTNLADVGKITAGMRLESTRDGNSPVLRVRGIGTQRFNVAVKPSVGVFVDEIAKTRIDSAFTTLNDVERIEILKGPQATLYGKQVSAGLISIITQKPVLEEFEGQVQARIGNNDLQEYRGTLNVPVHETIALRGNAYVAGSEFSQYENILTGDSEDTDTYGGRVRALFQPTDTLQAILTLEHHHAKVKDVGLETSDYGPNLIASAAADGVTLIEADGFDGEVQLAAPTERKTDTDGAALHLAWDVNDAWTLNSISSYEKFERDPGNIGGDGASSALTGAGIVVGPRLPGGLFFKNFVDDESWSQELRMTYSGDRLSSIVGLFYAFAEQKNDTDIARRVNPSLMNPIGGSQDRETEDIAIFTHNTWQWTDRADITFGLRYSETESDDVLGTVVGGGEWGETPPGLQLPRQKETWDAFSGTLKLTYAITDDATVYGGYDRGYKAGGFNSPLYLNGEFSDPAPFDEETADNYEIGIKGRFFDQRLRLSIAAFYQTYDDFQLPIPDPVTGIGLITQNAGEVISQGVETEFTYLISEKWVADGNIAYIDSDYDDFTDAPCYGGQPAPQCTDGKQDLSGDSVDNHSPWTAALNLTRTDQLGDTGMTWYARGEYAFRDDYIGLLNQDPRAMQDSYYLLNASVGLNAADDSWTVVLWGKNLTDEEYASTFLAAPDEGIPGSIPSMTLRPGEERTYGVELTYRF